MSANETAAAATSAQSTGSTDRTPNVNTARVSVRGFKLTAFSSRPRFTHTVTIMPVSAISQTGTQAFSSAPNIQAESPSQSPDMTAKPGGLRSSQFRQVTRSASASSSGMMYALINKRLLLFGWCDRRITRAQVVLQPVVMTRKCVRRCSLVPCLVYATRH